MYRENNWPTNSQGKPQLHADWNKKYEHKTRNSPRALAQYIRNGKPKG